MSERFARSLQAVDRVSFLGSGTFNKVDVNGERATLGRLFCRGRVVEDVFRRARRVERLKSHRWEIKVSISERKKELKCRRKRREQLTKMKAKLPTLDAAGKAVFAAKLRRMTPGAEDLIRAWGLE